MVQNVLAASAAPLYVDPIKIAIAAVLFVGWAAGVQWIDRDTDVVKTQRERWNLIVLSGSFVAFLVFFIPPWSGGMFWVGVVFWLLIVGSTFLAYIFHRNGRVSPDFRVLTLGHLKRLLPGGAEGAKPKSSKGLQIRLNDHAGKFVDVPTTSDEIKTFELVQSFLYEILSKRVSDLDMTPGKEEYRVIYRIDGVAGERPEGIPLPDGERMIQFLKKIAGLKTDEIRRPQAGKIQAGLLNAPGDPGTAEVKTSGSTAGERLQLHIQSGPALMRLSDLGIAPQREEIVRGFLNKKKIGLVLISAPPRHGMTTTQYAILRSHDAYMNNIYALERRKLLDLDNVTQNVYEGANSDVNYARMLQTILRREPDIVLVDDCEDRETARIASRAAAEDRKIYMGIQAKDCFDALSKYISLLEDHAMAAKALIGVTNQRLMRVLCTECREAYRPDEATLKKLNLPADKIERFYRPPTEQKLDRKGKPVVCATCQGTGYVGRVGVFEVMNVDPSVAAMIAAGEPINRIKAQCRKNKMYYLQDEGLYKVIDGTTSMNEFLRCLGGNEK